MRLGIKIFVAILVISNGLLLFKPQVAESQANDTTCNVHISKLPIDDSSPMYPGERAEFFANVTQGTAGNYTWSVEGPIIKDYDDDVYTGDLTASLNLDEPTYMLPSDFSKPEIQFYWLVNESDTNRTISVNVSTPAGETCSDSKQYAVAMNNNDINLQAEDFYVEKNHPLPLVNTTRVLQQHDNWHLNHAYYNGRYNGNGDLFFDFHRLYFGAFR